MSKLIARFGPVVEKITNYGAYHKKGFFQIALISTALISGILALFVSPVTALVFAAMLLSIYAVWRKPEAVVLILAVYTPFEPFLLKFVGDNFYIFARYAPEALIYGLALSVISKLIIKKLKFQDTPLDLPFIFLIVSALTSILINAAPITYSILGLRQITRFIILFFVVVQLRPSKELVKKITALM